MPSRRTILGFSPFPTPSAAHLMVWVRPDSQHRRLSVRPSPPLLPLQRFTYCSRIRLLRYFTRMERRCQTTSGARCRERHVFHTRAVYAAATRRTFAARGRDDVDARVLMIRASPPGAPVTRLSACSETRKAPASRRSHPSSRRSRSAAGRRLRTSGSPGRRSDAYPRAGP